MNGESFRLKRSRKSTSSHQAPDNWDEVKPAPDRLPLTPRSLAGNPDSPQVGVFLTSIIDETVGVATYYMHYHAIEDSNTSASRSAKPGQWLSGQTSSLWLPV